MAIDSPTSSTIAARHSLSVPELQRGRLHAELAGMDALAAARAVTHAQRSCSGGANDQVLFWHALYVQLAPLHRPCDHMDTIANALTVLSLECRTAVLLRLGEQMSPKTIAAVMDEPESRAGHHLAHAVVKIRQHIAKGRSDSDWLRELGEWIHAHEPASARLQAAPVNATIALPPAWTSAASPPRFSNRLWVWLGLAGILTAVGLARFFADDWISLQNRPLVESAPAADPVAELLTLPSSDVTLIDSDLSLTLLPRLDFYFWMAGRGLTTATDKQPVNSGNPARHRLAASTDRAATWQQLADSERAALLQRLAEWHALSAAERAALRLNLPHWTALDVAARAALVRQHNAYLATPLEARAKLDAEFEALSPTQRRALLPNVDSNEHDLARELFVFVPMGEYTATIEMLDALSEDAQSDLRELTRRLPPWQREALRVELLTQPQASRAEWLKQRRSVR